MAVLAGGARSASPRHAASARAHEATKRAVSATGRARRAGGDAVDEVHVGALRTSAQNAAREGGRATGEPAVEKRADGFARPEGGPLGERQRGAVRGHAGGFEARASERGKGS